MITFSHPPPLKCPSQDPRAPGENCNRISMFLSERRDRYRTYDRQDNRIDIVTFFITSLSTSCRRRKPQPNSDVSIKKKERKTELFDSNFSRCVNVMKKEVIPVHLSETLSFHSKTWQVRLEPRFLKYFAVVSQVQQFWCIYAPSRCATVSHFCKLKRSNKKNLMQF